MPFSEPLGVFLVYTGFLLVLVGLVCALKPLRFLRIRNRRDAGIVLLLGLSLVLGGRMVPARMKHSMGGTRIDDFAPRYQFNEFHSIRVHAPRNRIFQAIKNVPAGEIRFFQTLTWIRKPRFKRSGENILEAPAEKPILDVALRSGFLLLAEESRRELVVGAIVCCGPDPGIRTPEDFRVLEKPNYAKATMNFRVEEQAGGWSKVTTETRVYATDILAERKFAAYWRVIYPGSALIRRMWLAAIKTRAERPNS